MSARSLSSPSARPSLSLEAENLPATEPRFRWSCYLGQFLGAGQFFGTGFLLSLRQIVRGRTMSQQRASEELARLFAWNLRHYQRWGCLRLDCSALADLQPESGLILAANHPSLFDAVVVLACLPQTTCVMRAGLMRHPAMRGVAQNCRFIPNDSGADFVRVAVERLHGGMNLLIFPEGTRTAPGETLGKFKAGFALVAEKSGRPVQTLLIEHEGRNLGKGDHFWAPGLYPVTLRFRLGERFRPESNERSRDFCERVRQYFLQALPASAD